MVAGLAVCVTWLTRAPRRRPLFARRLPRPGLAALTLQGFDRDIAITPDGSRIVYRGSNQLLVRALDQLEPTVLSGLGAPRGVFVSPDGQWVGFVDGTTMKKVAITGGPPETIAPSPETIRGATWSEDGTIIFATASATGLHRVSATGGEPTVLTTPNREREGDHVWPEFLPGGGAVLFTITPPKRGIENAQIAVSGSADRESKVLIRGASRALYVPTGPSGLRRRGDAARGGLRPRTAGSGRNSCAGARGPDDDRIGRRPARGGHQRVARLRRRRGRSECPADRRGGGSPGKSLTAAWPPPDAYRDVRVSPGGARLALTTQNDLLTYDFTRAAPSRLITDQRRTSARCGRPTGNASSIPRDGRATRSCSGGRRMAPAARTGSPRQRRSRSICGPNGWSADGKQLLFTQVPQSVVRDRSPRHRETRPTRPCSCKTACTTRPSRQTDTGWPTSRTGTNRRLRRKVSGARKPDTDLNWRRSYPDVVAGRQGIVLSAAWTVGGCLRSRCGRNDVRRRAPAGLVRIRDARSLWVGLTVRPRSRRTVRDHPQW